MWPFGWIGSPWFTLPVMTLVFGWFAWGIARGPYPWAAIAPGLVIAGLWWQDAWRLRGYRMFELSERPIRWAPTAVAFLLVAPSIAVAALATGESGYWRFLGSVMTSPWTLVGALLLGMHLHPKGRARMLAGVTREREYEQERQGHWESDRAWEERLARRYPEAKG